MLRKKLYETVELESFEHNGNRYYILPKNGVAVPSVTTVIYKDVVFPDTAAMRRARQRGTAVHDLVERYLEREGEMGNLLKEEMPANKASFLKIKDKVDAHMSHIHVIEGVLYSTSLWTAGRVDCIAQWDGEESIVDFKTAKEPKRKEDIEKYFIQAATYAWMCQDFFPYPQLPIKNLVIIVAPDHHEEAQVFVEPANKYSGKVAELFIDQRRLYEN